MSDSANGEPLAVAARYDTAEQAREAAETLILRGIGAMTEVEGGPEGSHAVMVVPAQTGKAREILGLADETEPAPEPPKRRQLAYVLAIFGVALIVLPLLAFFVSYKLAGG